MGSKADLKDVTARRYWRAEEARVVVESWRRSAEPLGRFAKRHGVDPRRLARWAARLERAEVPAMRFHPVRLAQGGAIEIELGAGRCVRVPRGFDAEELRRVLAVLEDAARC